ncbi:hypothetical protein O181_085785 [Austropuccinia psidii MF-1]|uniref:Uncharacterized protein n=1 Tax=Austropuccinia psidii MF-1 TaxID=1389203 RepID=A0A9Q3IN18_9BASI|nr:hypothetical protein [Austropuccinia psidii MF-1]
MGIIPRISKRNKVIKDWNLVAKENQQILEFKLLGLPTFPTIGSILSPHNLIKQLLWDLNYNEAKIYGDSLEEIINSRYLQRNTVFKPPEPFDIEILFSLRDDDFKQSVRTIKDGFTHFP